MNTKKINLIYLDHQGTLHEDPSLVAVGINGKQVEVADQTWIDLPASGELTALSGRLPLGFNEGSNEIEVIDEFEGQKISAVAAVLPVGLTRTLLPGYEMSELLELPLLGYTAVGAENGRLKVAAVKTDADLKWNPLYYNTRDLARLIKSKRRQMPQNRLVDHLAKCALEYHCLTAQNIFYERWEAGIPVSPLCNASCLGCISKQPAECCPSPQGRIEFVPTPGEVIELAAAHLENAADAIISFGQGCEGEPSLQQELLIETIQKIRELTLKGTVNINSNAGNFAAIQALVDAGLDSIRISLFSAVPENYIWYHRPSGYNLADVESSARYAAAHGVAVALNLLFYPGFTNQDQETAAFYKLIATTGVKQIQLRNLNLDPEKMAPKLIEAELPSIPEWLEQLKTTFPEIRIGNYSQPQR